MKKQRPARKVVFKAVGILVGLGFLSAVIGVVIWSPDNPRARSVREWLTAVGTVGAVVVALWVTWSDRRRREREDADSEEAFQRAEAQSVIAFIESIPFGERKRASLAVNEQTGLTGPTHYGSRLVCENWSKRPIRMVEVQAFPVDEPSKPMYWLSAQSLGPNGKRHELVMTGALMEWLPSDFRVVMQFVDIHGTTWEREELRDARKIKV